MAGAVDLSSVFGVAAASSLRRLRRRRTREAGEPEVPSSGADEFTAVDSDAVEPETMEDDVQDRRTRRGPPAARPARPAPGRSDAPASRRRSGVVKVRDRHDIDLLLLAAATEGPASGHELIDLVHERSDGIFVLSVRAVYYRLRWLRDNRLMQDAGNRGVRRYVLTPLGERVLATRRREREAFFHGLNGVLAAADDL